MSATTAYARRRARAVMVGALGLMMATASAPASWGTAFTSSAAGITYTNFAGYAATTATSVTLVQATWNIPRVDCSVTPTATSSEWVGVGGDNVYPFPQAGTDADCVSGHASYDVWCSKGAFATNHHVSPGDSITTKVWSSGGHWHCAVTDNSTKRLTLSAEITYRYKGDTRRADFIVERVTENDALTDLADFSPVVMSGLKTSPTVSFTKTAFAVQMVEDTKYPAQSLLAAPTLNPLTIRYKAYDLTSPVALPNEHACGRDATANISLTFADQVSCHQGLVDVNNYLERGEQPKSPAGWSCTGFSGPGFMILCRLGNPNPEVYTYLAPATPHFRAIDS